MKKIRWVVGTLGVGVSSCEYLYTQNTLKILIWLIVKA